MFTALTPQEKELVVQHLPLVRKITACKLRSLPKAIEFDDLYQIGSLGLIRAVKNYTPNHAAGASFATFASYRIEGTIKDYLRNLLGRSGQKIEIANASSLDAVQGDFTTNLLNSLESKIDIENDSCDHAYLTELLNTARLSEREQFICKSLAEGFSKSKIANELGVSAGRVSQIINDIQDKLLRAKKII